MNPSASDSQIRDYVRRPKLYRNIDGTGELFVGAMLGAGAAVVFVQQHLPADSFWRGNHRGEDLALMYGVPVTVLALALWAAHAIKKRITFPRTGYVVPQRSRRTTAFRAVATALVVAGTCAATEFLIDAARRGSVVTSRSGIISLFTASYVAAAAAQFKSHRWRIAIAALLAAGLLALADLAPASASNDKFMLPAMLLTSFAWLLSGAITLLLYIRCTKAPEAEGE